MSRRSRSTGRNVLAVLLAAMIAANLAFIWVNSAKVSTESNESSHKVAQAVAERTVKDFDTLPKAEQQKHIKKANTKVRSMAHFTEFIPLGVLVYALFVTLIYSPDYRRLCLFGVALSLVMCALCALGDEIHQIFVKGRSFEVKDILVDTLGSLVGTGGAGLVSWVVYTARKNRGNGMQ